MKDKTTNKEAQLRVRLTPHQSFMLDDMCEKLDITKSALIRYILDQFIKQYDLTNVGDMEQL